MIVKLSELKKIYEQIVLPCNYSGDDNGEFVDLDVELIRNQLDNILTSLEVPDEINKGFKCGYCDLISSRERDWIVKEDDVFCKNCGSHEVAPFDAKQGVRLK
jgi:hypothetical protein